MPTNGDLTEALKREALRLGFDLVGVCRAVAPPRWEQFHRWLAAGMAGQMRYMTARSAAYGHPRHVLEGVRSILMLGTGYRTAEPAATAGGEGRLSRYAWGRDYHAVLRDRLARLIEVHRRMAPHARVRGVVDTAPFLERQFAELAGLGWIGKNTMLVNQRLGSWVFLAALLTTELLAADEPHSGGHCGTCRACLDACPTGALVEPYLLDARRCISYLTIELRQPVPRDLRAKVGDWLFGCDVCQEVCPWNRRAPISPQQAWQPLPGSNPVALAGLLLLDEAAFRRRFRQTPLGRVRRRGLARNAALVLGNRPCAPAWEALRHGLGDVEPLVRGACAWALGRYQDSHAKDALRQRLAQEHDLTVRQEIVVALGE